MLRADNWLAAGLLLIGAGLAAVALLGPLVTGVVDCRVTETLRNQTIGLDAVSLFVVAPLSFFAAVVVLRGRIAGHALALGIGAYTSYMLVQYVVGPDYTALAGNNERIFPLCLVVFTRAGSPCSRHGTESTTFACRSRMLEIDWWGT